MFKKILINSIIVFGISFLFHDLYSYLPFFPVTVIAPVNESIFEHMKLIFSSYMFFTLIIYLFYKKKPNNYVASNVLGALFNIVIFLIIFIPVYLIIGENIVVTLIIYFITIFVTNYLKEKLEDKPINKKLNLITGLSIILIYIIFGILTYFPIKNELLFMDPTSKSYGIDNLNDWFSCKCWYFII